MRPVIRLCRAAARHSWTRRPRLAPALGPFFESMAQICEQATSRKLAAPKRGPPSRSTLSSRRSLASRRVIRHRRGGPDAGVNLAGTGMNQCLVAAEIFLRHSLCGKSLLELHSHLTAIKFGKSSDRCNGFRFSRHDKAGYAVIDDFRHRA